jgi:hypothetical protein
MFKIILKKIIITDSNRLALLHMREFFKKLQININKGSIIYD